MKIKELFIALAVMVMSISCSNRYGGIRKNIFHNYDKMNLKIGEEIVGTLDSKSDVTLFSFFSEKVKDSIPELQTDIKKLFATYEGSVVDFENFAMGLESKIDDSKKIIEYHTTFKVKINEDMYFLYYIYLPRNDFSESTEGVSSIKFIRACDEYKYFCTWQDMKEGVFIPCD